MPVEETKPVIPLPANGIFIVCVEPEETIFGSVPE